MNKSMNVALHIINSGREVGINDISPLKLQKLIYLTYEEHARNHREALFNDNFEVWRHGPVVRTVYDFFKSYGSEVIEFKFSGIDNLMDREMQSIQNTLHIFGELSAWDLVDITHRSGGPWDLKMKSGDSYINFEDVLDANN